MYKRQIFAFRCFYLKKNKTKLKVLNKNKLNNNVVKLYVAYN